MLCSVEEISYLCGINIKLRPASGRNMAVFGRLFTIPDTLISIVIT